MLAIVLLLAAVSTQCHELCEAKAVEQYARLNALSGLNHYEFERAAFLVQRADGRLITVLWPPGDYAEASHKGQIPERCVAVIHTHPARTPLPSRHDIAEAQRIGLPIVVITPQSVTVATPEGTIDQLFEAGWTRR